MAKVYADAYRMNSIQGTIMFKEAENARHLGERNVPNYCIILETGSSEGSINVERSEERTCGTTVTGVSLLACARCLIKCRLFDNALTVSRPSSVLSQLTS